MTLAERDRRALMALGAAIIVTGIVYFWPAPKLEIVGGAASNLDQAAARLQRLRREASQLGIREDLRKKAETELAQQEKGLITGESAAQVEAQLLQIARRVARSQSPALDLRGTDFGTVRTFGEDYAEALLTLTLECQIEQLINFMADLSVQPELLSVDEMHITATNNKQKTISVRMAASGLTRAPRPVQGVRR